MAAGDEYMLDAHEVVPNYLETHLHATLTKKV